MNERRDFYVYIWFRPWDGSPCNVGKGRGKRYREWWRPSNPRLVAIIRKAGGSLPSVIIRDGLTEAEAFETERALIAAIGRKEKGLWRDIAFDVGGPGNAPADNRCASRREGNAGVS